MVPEAIPVDCFYVGKNVKDKNSALFKKFSKHILEEIKALFVIAANKRGLTISQTIHNHNGKKCTRSIQVTKAMDIAAVFCQISPESLQNNIDYYRNKLYDVMYEDFGKNWEIALEVKVMKDLGYCYSDVVNDFEELCLRKGDVAKLITAKYREEKCYIMEKIEAVHGRGTLNISRRRINGCYVDGNLIRGGRSKRKFYTGIIARKVSYFMEQRFETRIKKNIDLINIVYRLQ